MVKRLSLPFTQNARAQARKSLRGCPRVELLEDRLVPTANVTASLSGGVLTITGDTTQDQIAVAETPSNGVYTVAGGVNTQVNGQAAQTFGTSQTNPVTSITVNFHGTTDTVFFQGEASTPNSFLAGNLTATDSGNLQVSIDGPGLAGNGFNVTGLTTITANGNGTLAAIVGNGGSATSSNSTTLTGGLLTFGGNQGSSVTVQSGATVGFVSDNNSGAGANVLSIQNATVSNFVSFTGGTGNDVVAIGGTGAVAIGGNVAVALGTAGNDVLAIGVTEVGAPPVTIGGWLETFGSGADSLAMGSLTGKNVVIGSFISVNWQGSTSADTLVMEHTTDGGFLSIVTGSGNDVIILANDLVSTQTALFTGAGADSVGITGSQFEGTTFSGPLQGAFDIRAQGGNDIITIGTPDATSTQVFGPASIQASDGDNTLQLGQDGETVTFLNAVILNGGSGGSNTANKPFPANVKFTQAPTESNGW